MPNTTTVLPNSLLGICITSSIFASQAGKLSAILSIPILSTSPPCAEKENFVLLLDEQGLALQPTGKKAPGAIRVDFAQGANAHRRQFGGGKGQLIAKAVGLKSAYRPQIIDATAGLGQDAFVLAALGCGITLLERSPVIFHLLADGLERAKLVIDSDLQGIVERMQLFQQHGADYLEQLESPVDVIYLDPMFPERKSKAEVNKSMKALHSLVGADNDAGVLLKKALEKAIYRVVVKRPRKAPALHEQHVELSLPAPSLVLEGKSTRYDIYTFKKMP